MLLGSLEFRACTFFRHLELAALGDLDCLGRLVARALGHVLDLVDDLEALEDLAEDNVLAVEPGGDGGGNEELRAVGVFSGVGHACRRCLSAICSSSNVSGCPNLLKRYFLVCFNLKFSSGNLLP